MIGFTGNETGKLCHMCPLNVLRAFRRIIIEICVSLNFALGKFKMMYAEMDSEVFGNIGNTMFHRLALGHGGVRMFSWCLRGFSPGPPPPASSHNRKAKMKCT